MELLLWMWLYDSRWFFDFKISIKLYKLIWLIPLLMHLTITTLCFYDLHKEENNETCESSLKIWLFCRIFFSLLISLNILIFMLKISANYNREISFFKNAKKIFPYLNETDNNYDFWIKRNSVFSTPGILMLILGFISLFWSYIIMRMYYRGNKFTGCGELNELLLTLNSIFIFIGNIPLFIMVFILTAVKIIYFSCAYLCPECLINKSNLINSNKLTGKD